MATISLLIATYNNVAFLQNCLQSVLEQIELPDEVIIAEDYPLCESEPIAQLFVEKGLPIRYYKHAENRGRTKNYRFLLETAQSEYVMFLDGDDQLIDPYFFKDAKETLCTGKYVMYSAGCQKYYSENNKVISSVTESDTWMHGIDYFCKWITAEQTLPHSSSIFSREIALQSDAYSVDVLNTDIVSLRKILLHGDIFLLTKVVSQWNYHQSNASCQFDIDESVENLRMFTVPYQYAVSLGLSSYKLRLWRFVAISRYIITISHAMFPSVGCIIKFIFKSVSFGLK